MDIEVLKSPYRCRGKCGDREICSDLTYSMGYCFKPGLRDLCLEDELKRRGIKFDEGSNMTDNMSIDGMGDHHDEVEIIEGEILGEVIEVVETSETAEVISEVD